MNIHDPVVTTLAALLLLVMFAFVGMIAYVGVIVALHAGVALWAAIVYGIGVFGIFTLSTLGGLSKLK